MYSCCLPSFSLPSPTHPALASAIAQQMGEAAFRPKTGSIVFNCSVRPQALGSGKSPHGQLGHSSWGHPTFSGAEQRIPGQVAFEFTMCSLRSGSLRSWGVLQREQGRKQPRFQSLCTSLSKPCNRCYGSIPMGQSRKPTRPRATAVLLRKGAQRKDSNNTVRGSRFASGHTV